MATTRLAWLATARRGIGATAATTFVGAWYYRPVADQSTDGTGPRRDQELFCSCAIASRVTRTTVSKSGIGLRPGSQFSNVMWFRGAQMTPTRTPGLASM